MSEAKVAAATLGEAELLDEIAWLISETSGYPFQRITADSRLREDIGVCGDDGDDLLTQLDERFAMDWTGIDSGVIFGNEGFGPPPLWLLRNNCDLYERQTLTVGMLAESLRAGRWLVATPMIPLGGWRRISLYLGSVIATLVWGAIPVALMIAAGLWLVGA